MTLHATMQKRGFKHLNPRFLYVRNMKNRLIAMSLT